MSGGDASIEDMIASTRRGVLITRFWYIRPLNPRTVSVTGITRDGTFLIEDGRISRPVNNFRFNQSLVELLASRGDARRADPGSRRREQLGRGADRGAGAQSARVQPLEYE